MSENKKIESRMKITRKRAKMKAKASETSKSATRLTQNHQNQQNLPKTTFKMAIMGRRRIVCVQSTRLSKEPYFRSPIKVFLLKLKKK